MASSQSSPGIKLSSKRPRLSSNYEKCIKCQTVKKNEKLQNGMESSVVKYKTLVCKKNCNDAFAFVCFFFCWLVT